jgi:predicted N-acyltransferase
VAGDGGTGDGGLHAGLNAEQLICAGQGQQPQHLRLRRGQDDIAAAAPGFRLHPQQGAQ